MKNQKGISMIALIITIIVIIILAAIVFIASGDTMSSAQFSTFCQEFGDYALNFKNDPLADVQLKYGTEGVAITTAQAVAEATGIAHETGAIIPAGYNVVISNLKGGTDTINGKVCYFIPDTNVDAAPEGASFTETKVVVDGYDDYKFYGDNLGSETHWVTQEGTVFTLPGYPRKVDNTTRMYVTTELYYEANEALSNLVYGKDSTDNEGTKSRTNES